MTELFKDQIAIIGTGCTKFGENFNQSWADLALDAATEACEGVAAGSSCCGPGRRKKCQ